MSTPSNQPPLGRNELIDLGFIDARAKVLDIAAFFDRVDRATRSGAPSAPAPDNPAKAPTDFRVDAIREALSIAVGTSPARAERILKFWSDPSTLPVARADGKGALGVAKPSKH